MFGSAVAALTACMAAPGGPTPDDTATSSETALITAAAWEPASGVDPLAADAETGAICAAGGLVVEGQALEIDTGLCPYVWLEQPMLAGLRVGDPVEVVVWHNDLVADGPAEGHIALMIDGVVLWERVVPIPAQPCAYSDVVTSPVAASAGTALQLHLHNHGANTWNVFRALRLGADASPVTSPGCG